MKTTITTTTKTKTFILLGCSLFVIPTIYLATDYLHGLSTTSSNITFFTSSNSTNNIAIAIAIESRSNFSSSSSSSSVIIITKNTTTNKTTTVKTNTPVIMAAAAAINMNTKKKKKKKKFVLIHIGPSKTGTTTIQKDSGEDSGYIQALQHDNTLYVGKFHSRMDTRIQEWRSSMACMTTHIFGTNNGNYSYGVNKNGHTIILPIIHISVNDTEKKKQKQLLVDQCWQQQQGYNNTNTMMMMNGTTTIQEMNIIDSDEGYSYQLEKLRDRIQIYHTIFVDYLHYDEVIIVGTYRRYYDWLPSTWKEQTKNFCFGFDIPRHKEYLHSPKNTCNSLWDFMWKRYIQRANQYNTGRYQNIHRTLPIAREIVLSTNTTPTDNDNNNNNNNGNVVANHATTNKVEILNYFQLPNEEYYNSITTELYCQVLGLDRTPHTCQHSRQKGVTAEVHHKGYVDNVPYKLILKEAHQRGWVSGYPVTSNNYQAMLYANSTIQTWKDLQDYHTQLLLTTTTTQTNTHNSSSEGDDESTTATTNVKKNGRMIFPLLCPTKSQLATFLHKSLQFEKLVMPHFSHTALGEQAHTKAFWHVTANGTRSTDNLFCSIDIPTFFGTVTSWEQLIEERLSIEAW